MIEILVPYYRNLKMMDYQLFCWEEMSVFTRREIKITIVDDGSPKPLRIVDRGKLNLSLYRIKENIPWNIAGAKNLLAHVCASDWFLMYDIDYVVPVFDLRYILELDRSNPDIYYNFHVQNASLPVRRRPSKIAILMNTHTFWEVGGFNEAFTGSWGLQMSDLRQRLKQAGKKVKLCKDITLTHYSNEEVEDASTTDWPRDSAENMEKMKTREYVKPLQFDWELVHDFTCQD